MEWVRDHFGHWSSKLPAEVAFTDGEYATDVCNPRRLNETSFTLSGVAYAFGFGADVTDQISSIVEATPAPPRSPRQAREHADLEGT